MKFGLALPYGTPRMVANLSQLAEESGWDGIFLGDAIWAEDPMIGLAAAAMVTRRIRLGTMIVPAPLRKPWKLASETLALDYLSDGRITLGLGAGAVWMGWQAFPDEISDTQARAEMLDETIDILTLLYQRKQFDFDGKHFHIKLTRMDLQHYPRKPVQQPRIPLWVVGIWPKMKSMRRVLKADGMFVEARDAEGKAVDATPDDIRKIKAYIDSHRELATPFDIVISGTTGSLEPEGRRAKLLPYAEAGATWWVEGLWEGSEEQVMARIRQGPPLLG
jgi:alkanesulfonate monooxygenase SsuD/methylene tetrahydromethanopterin reductase-like flavin-dependent oxidoreductase (luciferase family)